MSQFTFREVKNGEFIGGCGAMLPNRMRCYKPGKFVVLSDSNAKEGTFREYQVCTMHAVIMDKLGTTVGPIKPIEGTGTVAAQEIPQKELEPKENEKKETENKEVEKEKKNEQPNGTKS